MHGETERKSVGTEMAFAVKTVQAIDVKALTVLDLRAIIFQN